MVIKIYAPAPSTSSAVQYNERKVAEGKASVIFSSKIDDPSNAMKTFERYENGSIRCQNMSFHASVNPSITDKIPEEKIPDFIREYMEKMGYGNQPYILYKHTDTGRVHYHLVSVRVDENGRKIPDYKERIRSQKAMKELAAKYGFEIGKKKENGETKGKKESNPYQGFDPSAGEYGKQIERIAELAMTYHFTNPRQFTLIMESLGVKVIPQNDGTVGFVGLDPKTHKDCTSVIKDSGIRYPTMDEIDARAKFCKGRIKTREKQRVTNITRMAMSKCKTELHFRRYLAGFGIHAFFSKTAGGKIFGATMVDHQTKCVFKASELGIKASEFEELRTNVWKEDGDEKEKTASAEIADIALAAAGAERSRRAEDEEIMRRGRRGPGY